MTDSRTAEDVLRAADAFIEAQIPGFEPNIPFVVSTKALIADLAAALRETLAENEKWKEKWGTLLYERDEIQDISLSRLQEVQRLNRDRQNWLNTANRLQREAQAKIKRLRNDFPWAGHTINIGIIKRQGEEISQLRTKVTKVEDQLKSAEAVVKAARLHYPVAIGHTAHCAYTNRAGQDDCTCGEYESRVALGRALAAYDKQQEPTP